MQVQSGQNKHTKSVNYHLSSLLAELIDRTRYSAFVRSRSQEELAIARQHESVQYRGKTYVYRAVGATFLIGSLSAMAAFTVEFFGKLPVFGNRRLVFFAGSASTLISCAAFQARSYYADLERIADNDCRKRFTSSSEHLALYDRMTLFRTTVALSPVKFDSVKISDQAQLFQTQMGDALSKCPMREDSILATEKKVGPAFFAAEHTAYVNLGLDPAFALRGVV